ncbi:NADP-dependent oxidoreductase [Streptomyces sp. AJS327]|uniref:NADP-dependent oxidoreductase n=1 Tax=Streptomyces sp. AJS327 TaxID=2545265 RepID=UPI0015DE044C|nr:NADP-dependent oxidoreductase [Streptomyces sp. AJS327]MBA0053774.1 NADP-dependent oxidoreductase [Streptomyces sp. AJS327]
MKAIALDKYGSADELHVTELPEPKVTLDEVLVRVRAAAVNPVDWKIAAGHLDPVLETRFPLVPGWDVAGVVERTGLDAGEFSVGDEVFGYVRKDWAQQGTYAELVSANVRLLARKPRTLSWEETAGLPLSGLTALQSVRRVRLSEGETVLIHAAAGGVGTFAVQLAVDLGARVIGTASEAKHEYLRSLGAEPVTYGDGLADRVRALAPDGIDAALDFGGDDAVRLSTGLLNAHEHRSRIASVVDTEAERKGAHYVWVRPDAAGLTTLADLADAGQLRVPIERTLPLEEAAEAWRLSQTGRASGKIVLTV